MNWRSKTNESICTSIELILSDVDGVLTPGDVTYNNEGIETKQFHIRDGLGIQLWQRAGYRFGIVTGRTSQIVKFRAAELNIELVRQGFANKLPVAREVADACGVSLEQVCYIGDDLLDLPVIKAVGLGVAVADAAPEVLAAAHYITDRPGGRGAVRELIEMLLKAKHRWQDIISRFE